MSKRAYVGLIVLVAVVTLGAVFIGEWFRAACLVALGVVGLVGTVRYEREKRRVVQFLEAQAPEDQDALLVWDEGWQDRPEILARLGRRGPRVPLRGERERFAYAPHHATMARWSFVGGVLITALAVGTALFALPPERGERLSLAALAVGFGAMTILMPWQIRLATSHIEVTDDAISMVFPDGTRRTVPWREITAAKDSWVGSCLVLRSGDGARFWIGHTIEGYGRLANLIATRLPEDLTWRAV